MKWSWRIGRIAGIDLNLHATFLVLLAWIAYANYQRGPAAVAEAVVYTLTVFATIVLHELGHAFTARRFGISTRDILLLPIGGVARLERMPTDPRQELLVALAGPAVNVVLAAIAYGILWTTGRPPTWSELWTLELTLSFHTFLVWFVGVNLFILGFNLLPAFPMDGGRVLRALIAMRTGNHGRATEIAARVGRVFAVLFAVYGFSKGLPFLMLIALFVWLSAGGEAAAAQTSNALDGVAIDKLMIRDIHTLTPGASLAQAVRLTLEGFQQDFPVVDDRGDLVGVLTRGDLLRALVERGDSSDVSSAMHREFVVARPEEGLDVALARLRTCGCQALPVVRGRELLGVLTLENVGEYIMIQSALQKSKA
jgi:Zn-dependent protease/CBS domain-containing protein